MEVWDDEFQDDLDGPAPPVTPAPPAAPAASDPASELGRESFARYATASEVPGEDSDPPTGPVIPWGAGRSASAASAPPPDAVPEAGNLYSEVPKNAAIPLPPPPPEESHFFPIPESVPEIPHEDTEEVRKAPAHRRSRKPRRGAFSRLFNALIWAGMTMFFVAAIVAVLYFRHAYKRLNNPRPEMSQIAILTVNPGDRFGTILDRLEESGLLTSSLGLQDRHLMWALTRLEGNSEKIQSGVYRLNASMSLREIYDRLIKGSQDFKITIPEGRTVRGVAGLVRRRIETFDADRFMELCRNPDFIASLGLDVDSLEGYLYPSTYFYGPGMSEEELIRMMVKTFRDTVVAATRDLTTTSGLTSHEHLIMASMIEREARTEQEAPLIASVLFNRLARQMPLQVDATVQYAVGDYSRPPKPEDMKVESPYNTYLNKGLPPGPICNPRLSSILATYRPEQTDYLFYVHKGDGTHAFSRTFEEHKENVRLYLKSDAAAKPPEASDKSSGKAQSNKASSPEN